MLLKLSSTVGTSLRVSLGGDQAEVGCWGSGGRGVQKRRPHYLNWISSSPHHMCHCSVSIHIFGQTGTYYLNYSSGSPHYICQFSLFGLQCFFTHIWAEWKYLSRVPSVAPPMCQSALDYTGWFCAVKYLIASWVLLLHLLHCIGVHFLVLHWYVLYGEIIELPPFPTKFSFSSL